MTDPFGGQAQPRIRAEVFSRIPDELRVHGRTSGWTFGKNNDGMDCFIEGPAFDRQGNLYVTDIPYGRILRISPDGSSWTCVAEYDGWPNGLAIHQDGRIFIADHRLGILSLDPQSGRISTVLDRAWREGFKGPNDLVFARNGDLYFTDQGQTGLQDASGRVYRLSAGGALHLLIDNVPGPNGLAFSHDGKTLFVAATRANQVWRLPLHADGTTSKVSAFLTLNGGIGPDGLAIDEDDGLAIAHVGRGCIWVYDRFGDLRYRIDCDLEESPTNLAFGGADWKTLYITGSDTGTIFTAKVPSAGQSLFSHS